MKILSKKLPILGLGGLLLSLFSCQSDDTDFSAYTDNPVNTIHITYSGNTATVTGDNKNYVTVNGADVVVNTGSHTDSLLLILSGSTSDGSLLIYREKKYGIQLNGVTIHNADGPAINNQCGKSLYMEVAAGTTNTLTDGTTYAEQSYDQKGALFSEGQIVFSGHGELSVIAVGRGGIRSDDYIRIRPGVKIYVNSSALDGLRANDGIIVDGGVLNIETTGAGAKGVRCGGVMTVNGGRMIAMCAGDSRTELEDDGMTDTTACAALYCDSLLTVNGGVLKFKATGDGGKGVNGKWNVDIRGGSFFAVATGTREVKKPKGVKLDGSLNISGGYFYSYSKRSDPVETGGMLNVAPGYTTYSHGPKVVTIAF